jgi:hypothetical protein
MNLHYLTNELYHQKRRTLTAILGLSIGIALLIILNALSAAYRQAAHAPLKEIGPTSRPAARRCAQGPEGCFPARPSPYDDQVKKIQGLDG